MVQKEYKVEYSLDKDTGQIIAVVPELNSVSSFGASFAEAESNIKDAATGYLEVLQKRKLAYPKPSKTAGTYLRLFIPEFVSV